MKKNAAARLTNMARAVLHGAPDDARACAIRALVEAGTLRPDDVRAFCGLSSHERDRVVAEAAAAALLKFRIALEAPTLADARALRGSITTALSRIDPALDADIACSGHDEGPRAEGGHGRVLFRLAP